MNDGTRAALKRKFTAARYAANRQMAAQISIFFKRFALNVQYLPAYDPYNSL